MATDVRELLQDAAGDPTEPVDTSAILRRAGRRRQRSTVLASIAALVVAGAAVVTVVRLTTVSEDPDIATRPATNTSAQSQSVVEIEQTPELVTIRLLDGTAAPADVERELRAAGLDVTVSTLSGDPTLVGQWADNSPNPQPDPGLGVVIEDRTVMRLPVGYRGQLTYYRPAQSGETYASTSGTAFDPGRPLHCSGVEHLTPAEAEVVINGLGYEVSWRYFVTLGVLDDGVTEGYSFVPDDAPDGLITSALLSSDSLLIVFVSPPDDPMASQSGIERVQQDC